MQNGLIQSVLNEFALPFMTKRFCEKQIVVTSKKENHVLKHGNSVRWSGILLVKTKDD